MSRAVLEAVIGQRPQHLAYPVGDPTSAGPREFRIAAELGFKTAVTTRPGVLFKAHRDYLTALPRISVNGEFQQQRYLKVLMSGVGTAFWNRFRRGQRSLELSIHALSGLAIQLMSGIAGRTQPKPATT